MELPTPLSEPLPFVLDVGPSPVSVLGLAQPAMSSQNRHGHIKALI
jgi:hypothetical protein